MPSNFAARRAHLRANPCRRGHSVIDHFNYDATTGAADHATVLASNYVQVSSLHGL